MTTLTTTTNLFKILDTFIKEVNKTNGSNDKMRILGKYPELKEILLYVNDAQITFGITSKKYKKYVDNKKSKSYNAYSHLYDFLNALKDREITGDTAASSLKYFISQYPQYEDLILRIIDRNLKTRMNTKAVNKVFPGLVSVFEVTLAEKYLPKHIKKGSKYYLSRKLDGVRCICFYSKGEIKFFSRAGNEFVDKNGDSTLQRLYGPLKEVFNGMSPTVFDGELCIVDENGKEDFSSVMKQIRKEVINPRYCIFDILTPEEFNAGEGNKTFRRRNNKLRLFENIHPSIKILEQLEMNDDNWEKMVKRAEVEGWEGLMIKRNVKYSSGRSKDLLKFKEFHDEEFKVIDIITGPFRMTSKETGLEVTIDTMTAVVIDFYGTRVGSGFSVDERQMFYKNPRLIIGKSITVQYFEKTKNQDNDDLSLRFPTYKCIKEYL